VNQGTALNTDWAWIEMPSAMGKIGIIWVEGGRQYKNDFAIYHPNFVVIWAA